MTMIVDEALNLQLKHIADNTRKATGATEVIVIVSDGSQHVMGLATRILAETPKEIASSQSRLWFTLLRSAEAFTKQISKGYINLQMLTKDGKVMPVPRQDIHSYEVRPG